MSRELNIIDELKAIIDSSRTSAIRAVDHERVLMYWSIGKRVFEEEQGGNNRAAYGDKLIN